MINGYRVFDGGRGKVFEDFREASDYAAAYARATGVFVAVVECRAQATHTFSRGKLGTTVRRVYRCYDWDGDELGTVRAVSVETALRLGWSKWGTAFYGCRRA